MEKTLTVRVEIYGKETVHFFRRISDERKANFEQRDKSPESFKGLQRRCSKFYDSFIEGVSGYFEGDQPVMTPPTGNPKFQLFTKQSL